MLTRQDYINMIKELIEENRLEECSLSELMDIHDIIKHLKG